MELNHATAGVAATNQTPAQRLDLTLSNEEIRQLTGFIQATRQLEELHRLGFWRARRGRVGIILEREHYRAVCAGPSRPDRPRVRPPAVRGA